MDKCLLTQPPSGSGPISNCHYSPTGKSGGPRSTAISLNPKHGISICARTGSSASGSQPYCPITAAGIILLIHLMVESGRGPPMATQIYAPYEHVPAQHVLPCTQASPPIQHDATSDLRHTCYHHIHNTSHDKVFRLPLTQPCSCYCCSC